MTALAPNVDELRAINDDLETRPATAAIEWANEKFGTSLVLAASFQNCVLIDLAAQVAPGIEVVFLDTQYHFAETLWYVEQVRKRYDLNLRTMTPEVPRDDRWLVDLNACCRVRKVEPMARALEGKAAWITGLQRVDAESRANVPMVHYDLVRNMVKVNPIARWSETDVANYIVEHDLPVHPLADKGYQSIGCWPCTRLSDSEDDSRAGRWAGSDKQECGLHV